MVIWSIILIIVALSTVCVGGMLYLLKKEPPLTLSFVDYLKLISSGILAFIADTIGVGSFAVNVALAKALNTFSDDELPAVNNGAQVIPGTIESLFFMQWVNVDLVTLITLVAGTCLGGLIGGVVVSRLSRQAIRFTMMNCFILIVVLMICHQCHLLPLNGEATMLQGWTLMIGFGALLICGALTSAGIGLFVMVQAVLFLLNVSPLVAFPIMMTAGAMQQPLTTMIFLQQRKIPLRKTLILSLAGCVGVGITLPIFNYLTTTWLHFLLLLILIYNIIMLGRAYFSSRRRSLSHSTNALITSV